MISTIRPLPAGSALRLWLTPPTGARWWRVLRSAGGAITGPTDPNAVVVADKCQAESILDFVGLVDGFDYTYQAFYWNGAAFIASDPADGTPAATWGDGSADAQMLLRERLDLAMAEEVRRGSLTPHSGVIPVVTAPFANIEEISFPAVSVYFTAGEPAERAIGEDFPAEAVDPDTGAVTSSEGWLQRVTLQVSAVSLNADERAALRRALLRAVTVNLPIFDEAGIVQVSFAQKDSEQFRDNAAPLYFTHGTFTCLAPAFVTSVTEPGPAELALNPTITEPAYGQA